MRGRRGDPVEVERVRDPDLLKRCAGHVRKVDELVHGSRRTQEEATFGAAGIAASAELWLARPPHCEAPTCTPFG